ncbi:uncharacterized mitochondrial protein-like protein [Tanacetum coccineum]
MNPVATQQIALDNALVAPKKRLKIELCNARIEFSKPQREATYQVTLDTLKLSPCYLAFLITVEVPEIYIHQFWNTIKKIKDTDAYQFKLDKKKNAELTLKSFVKFYRDDSGLGTLKFVSKTEDSHKYGALILEEMINQDIKDSTTYKTYLAFATGTAPPKKLRKFKKVASPSKKLSPFLEEDPTKKPKQAKKPAKKSTTVQTSSIVIRDTPSVFMLKKKAPAKDDRSKGIDLLSDVALLEAAQLKKAFKKCKKDSHMLHASGSNEGTGTKPGVPDVPQQNSVVKRQNQFLVKAAQTMLIFSKALLFLWAEAIYTACYTQNRSLIRLRYNKTPYELMHDKKPYLSYLHVFGSLCYPTNDSEDLGKVDAKADIGIFWLRTHNERFQNNSVQDSGFNQ